MSSVSSMFKETSIPKAWLDPVDYLEKDETGTIERTDDIWWKVPVKNIRNYMVKKICSIKLSGIYCKWFVVDEQLGQYLMN